MTLNVCRARAPTHWPKRTCLSTVMPGFMPGIHVFAALRVSRRGWPGQARPWRRVCGARSALPLHCHARPWRRVCGVHGALPLIRHARACRGHPRLSGLAETKDVDGRDEPGHDAECMSRACADSLAETHYLSTVMPGHDGDDPFV